MKLKSRLIKWLFRKKEPEDEERPPQCTCTVFYNNWEGQVIVFSTDCPWHGEYAEHSVGYKLKDPWKD